MDRSKKSEPGTGARKVADVSAAAPPPPPSGSSADPAPPKPRTQLINMEGGVQRTFVKCECSKCQGLVMCGPRELLPTAVRPTHYELSLEPNLEEFRYTGSVTVRLEVREPCNAVTFHAKELEISSGVVVDAAGAERTNPGGPDVLYGTKEQETATVALARPLTEADVGTTVTLALHFTGELNDKLAGFYRSAYKAPGSCETRHLAVTQFEPTDARRCFPCWDEPALKAQFDMTLVVPQDRVALSNMPEKACDLREDGKKVVTYETTPIMSTYLLAFVVGEFEHVEARTPEGVLVRCWTPVGQTEQGRFALDTAVQSLSFFGDYFDSPYPLPKMDMIAVPDFSAGAMENWGLVTYRSSLLLYEEGTTPVNAKQRIGYVVGHELAHQWFGNLVTMEWWSQLWLNEGFATWVGWRAMDHIYPDWAVWAQFVVNEQAMGLGLDSLKSSHPVEVEIASAAQVNEIFDAISYSKGSCVIRMLESYLGEATFRQGMRDYIKAHQYDNAGTTDLWAALSGASGKDVAALMSCWTQQTGFPVLHVGQEGDQVQVSQQRYYASGPGTAPEGSEEPLWIVPLRAAGLPETLATASASFPVPPGGVAKVNEGQSGFYRTVYDAAARGEVVRALPGLPEVDRVGVVSDAFATAAAGYASTTAALELLQAFEGEESYVVWSDISTGLGSIRSTWFEQGDDVNDALCRLGAGLYGPLVERLGWEAAPGAEEGHSTKLLRQLAVSQALACEHPATLEEATRRFAAFVGGDKEAIPADLKGAVYTAAVRAGGRAEFERMRELYKATDNAIEQSQCLSALGAAPDVELVLEALDFNLSDEVRMQDGAAVIGAAAGNRRSRRACWEWVQREWPRVEAKFGGGGVSSTLTRIVGASCSALASGADADAVEAFYGPKQVPGIERTVAQSCEAIRAKAARLGRDADAVAAWLAAH